MKCGENAMIQILIVESDALRAKRIAASMRELDYSTVLVPDAAAALTALEESGVQLIIAAGSCGGMELTRELRDA